MARRRSQPTTALLRTGPQAATSPVLVPAEGKGGVAVKLEPWGEGNNLPQEVLRVLYDSGTATTCVERLEQFIGGRGFTSEVTATTMANPGQTLNQLFAEASAYAAAGLGVAYSIRFSFGGVEKHVYVAPVDCLRREKDSERFVVNPKMASGKAPAAENEVYLPYDPLATPEELAAEVLAAVQSETGYWGHLWFSYTKKVGRSRYPIPAWWSAKEAVEADAEALRYDLKQFRNGFFPDAVMTVVGKRFMPTDDENWDPATAAPGELAPLVESPDLADIKKNIKDLKGASTQASVMVVAVEMAEEAPKLDFLDKGPNSKSLTDATARLEGRVYRRFGVPPVLCGVSEPGMLGSNQQIVNSIQLFGLVVNPARELCLGPLRHLFPGLDFTVTPLDPVDYIDPLVAAEMTPDELRATRGLKPLTPAKTETPTPRPRPRS